ncbi:unnamed protein product [Camellia sinensis]
MLHHLQTRERKREILAFKNKPPTPVEAIPNEFSAIHQSKPTKPRRYIPQTSGLPPSETKSATSTVRRRVGLDYTTLATYSPDM